MLQGSLQIGSLDKRHWWTLAWNPARKTAGVLAGHSPPAQQACLPSRKATEVMLFPGQKMREDVGFHFIKTCTFPCGYRKTCHRMLSRTLSRFACPRAIWWVSTAPHKSTGQPATTNQSKWARYHHNQLLISNRKEAKGRPDIDKFPAKPWGKETGQKEDRRMPS